MTLSPVMRSCIDFSDHLQPIFLCRRASRVRKWVPLTLGVIDDAGPKGRRVLTKLALNALAAILLDGRLVAVGVQTEEQAMELLRAAGKSHP